jgi:hypothetical protein
MMTWEVMQQLVRIIMYFVGGALSAYGIVFPPAAIAGMTVALCTLGWWAYWQFVAKKPAPPIPDETATPAAPAV